jgi:predicted O-methyltransferase YrrM
MDKYSTRRAYFTIVQNEEWVIGAVVLGHSLRKSGADASLVCQIGADVSSESRVLLETIYDMVEIVDEYVFPVSKYNKFEDVPKRLAFSFRRLNAWKRSEFDRITYLDSDLLVLRNIDSLFDLPGVIAPREYDFRVWKNGKLFTDFFNGGLVTFSPSKCVFEKFNNILMAQWIYMGAAEQHLVNVACRDNWLRLPDKYHVQAGTIHNRKFADDLDDAYVVHFSKIAKPWDIAYTGRLELRDSWKIFALAWINMLRDYEHSSGNCISPEEFGWQQKSDLSHISKKSSRTSSAGKKKQARRISRIVLAPTKMAEISVFKGAFQKISELSPLVRMLRRRTLRTVVEIGTFKGGTMWLWCQIANADANIVSIDLKPKSKAEKRIERYLYGLAVESQKVRLVRGDSGSIKTKDQLINVLGSFKIDFLFIDGDHSYRGVKRDFELYSPLVRKGGIVAFHDIVYHPNFPDTQVDKYWNELRSKYKFREFIDLDDERGWGQWGGIGVLYM